MSIKKTIELWSLISCEQSPSEESSQGVKTSISLPIGVADYSMICVHERPVVVHTR